MLYVTDLDRSIAFYTKAFDLKVANRLSQLEVIQPDGTTTTREVNMAFLKFADQDFVYEIAQHPQDTVKTNQIPLFQHIGIDVTNIETAYQKAIDAGGEVNVPVRTVKANNIEAKQAFIKGPDGERIELMQLIAGEF